MTKSVIDEQHSIKNEKEKPADILHNQKLNREEIRNKFMRIVENSGIDTAITEIHREMGVLEPRVFNNGFEADRFERLQYYRVLARELYNYQLKEDSKKMSQNS